MIDNEFRISRLMRIYLKSASAGSPDVRPYGEWSEETKQLVQNESGVTAGDSPFLMYYRAPSEWTIVTLGDLVWKLDGQLYRLRVGDIRKISYTDEAMEAMRQELAARDRIPRESRSSIMSATKESTSDLQCITESGDTFLLKWDPSGAIFGLWNLLRVMYGQAHGASLGSNHVEDSPSQ